MKFSVRKIIFKFLFSEEMLSILGIGVNLPSNVCLLTIMRILFPMPPEPQSVIKKATTNGGIEEANLENIDGQIKQGIISTSSLTTYAKLLNRKNS